MSCNHCHQFGHSAMFPSISLHIAAFYNRKEVVKLLMSEGAEINTIIDGQLHGAGRRIKGKTPLDLAVEKKHTEIKF